MALCLLASAPLLAASAPSLGTAQSFAVLGASAITNSGASVVTGDLGISPNNASSVTGFPPGTVIGTTHYADGVALGAQNDLTTAYNNLAGQACNATISADLGGTTLTPGVYCSASSMGLTGTVTLDAQGDPNAVFIFKSGSTLTTANNAKVVMINGGQNCNVFWQVGSSATLGGGTTFAGNLLALTSITMVTGASTNGRVLARNGAVTLDGSAVSMCSLESTPPTLAKAFSPATINAGGVTTLTLTLSNPNVTDAILSAPLIDTLPSGVVVAPTPNGLTNCSGAGTPVAAAGASSITLPAGRVIPANGSCTFAVNVTAAAGGTFINTLPIGALATNNGSNTGQVVATVTVVAPNPGNTPINPTLGKSFNPASVNAGSTSTLTVTLNNANNSNATLTSALVDTLPNGVVVATTPNLATSCGGSGAPTAIAGGTSVTLPAGRVIPANGSCTLTVDVSSDLNGAYINTLPAGALATSNGNNTTPVAATLTVVPFLMSRPTLSKAFSPTTINAGGIATLIITFSNPHTGVATLTTFPFVDTLPSGVVIAATPNVATTCGGSGAPTAVAGGSTVTLPVGRSIPAGDSCTLSVSVTAAAGGAFINTLLPGKLMTDNGLNAAPAVATLTVIPPGATNPTVGKAFSPASIKAGGISLLTITLTNPSAAIATLTAPLTDTLPSGVVVATVPNVATTCGGSGTPLAVAKSSTVTLPAGRTIPANSSCTMTVNVTAASGGSYINPILAGALVTSNGNNTAPTVASLTVVPPVIPVVPVTPVTPITPAVPGVPGVSANTIPTLSEWAMLLLAGLLGLSGFAAMRRQRN